MEVFKIVHLLELDEVEPIPYKWEDNGVVYWSKTMKECRRWQSNVHSEPDKKNWRKFKGVVKAVEKFYNDAAKAADLYADMDTDEAEYTRSSKRTKTSNTSTYLQFFEQQLEENTSPSPSHDVEKQQQKIKEFSQQADNNTAHLPELGADNTISDLTLVSACDISNIYEVLIEVKTSVVTLQDQMTTLQQQVAEVRTKQDHLEKLISKLPKERESDKLPQHWAKMFPLTSVKELKSFEEKPTSDKEYRSQVLEHWKCIIGTGSTAKIAAYKLCGLLFTTELLSKYSWTGISRLVVKKEIFKDFEEVLNIFFLVVNNADSSLTIADTDNFFKNKVLKYGQSRLTPRKKVRDNTDETDVVVLTEDVIVSDKPEKVEAVVAVEIEDIMNSDNAENISEITM